ncbi:aspartate aminotransferase family protein [Aquipuribacter sp. MA13-6]|uniref:aspartate aminotransferase family protein n=1 Tax=unclassified Aquipuribacter TaxID=2635084 RepID=UPI003EEF3527
MTTTHPAGHVETSTPGDGAGREATEGLLARHRAVTPAWQALYYADPIALSHGEGRHVWDVEGNRYLDFFGGILTTMTAHALPEVTAAVQEQAGKILHSSTLYLNEETVELAERIAELSGIPDAKVFLTPSGTEANDAALLMATVHRRSNQVLAMRNSYHGRSFSTIGITGHRSWSPTSFSGLQTTYVHGGYRLRSPFRDLPDGEYTAACVADLRQLLDMATSGDVACLIAEPIQGVGGFATPPDGFFGAIKEVLDAHGILFVSDEVQTGWGRTGEHFWGYQAHGITPDLLTFAKGVGNGLPLGGVVGRAEVVDAITGNHISTFGGSPLVSAGANANLRYLLEHDLQGNAKRVGDRLRAALQPTVEQTGWIAEMRGRGLMLALECVVPGGIEPDPARAAALLEATRARALLVGKGGLYGNVVRMAPPLTLTEAEADEGAELLLDAIHAIG